MNEESGSPPTIRNKAHGTMLFVGGLVGYEPYSESRPGARH